MTHYGILPIVQIQPRYRGEKNTISGIVLTCPGSAPLTRGTVLGSDMTPEVIRFSPADAGKKVMKYFEYVEIRFNPANAGKRLSIYAGFKHI